MLRKQHLADTKSTFRFFNNRVVLRKELDPLGKLESAPMDEPGLTKSDNPKSTRHSRVWFVLHLA